MSRTRLLYQPVKWLLYLPFFVTCTIIAALLCVLVCLFSPQLASRYVAKAWAKINLLAVPSSVTVQGSEHISSGQSYIVVANHVSLFDIFAVYGWLDLDLKWVMKKEIKKIPFIGFACAAMGHVFLDRSQSSKALQTLHEAKDSLPKGVSVMVFPEGTRSNGQMRKFKRGAFMMAKTLELPILPITIKGTEAILPSGTLDLYPGRAQLIIHRPISREEVLSLDEKTLIDRAQQQIQQGLNT